MGLMNWKVDSANNAVLRSSRAKSFVKLRDQEEELRVSRDRKKMIVWRRIIVLSLQKREAGRRRQIHTVSYRPTTIVCEVCDMSFQTEFLEVMLYPWIMVVQWWWREVKTRIDFGKTWRSRTWLDMEKMQQWYLQGNLTAVLNKHQYVAGLLQLQDYTTMV